MAVFRLNLATPSPLYSLSNSSINNTLGIQLHNPFLTSLNKSRTLNPLMSATNTSAIATTLEKVMQDAGQIFSKMQRVTATGLMVYSAIRPVANLFLGQYLSEHTIKIVEFDGLDKNLLFQAAQLYLTRRTNSSSNISSPRTKKATKLDDCNESPIKVTLDKGESVIDEFKGVKFKWVLSAEQGLKGKKKENQQTIVLSFELKFHQRYETMVVDEYLPYILNQAELSKQETRVVRLHTVDPYYYHGDPWASTRYDHPSTFDNLAMDPEMKSMIIKDLELFLSRGEFYRRVGKAWKRGYLLYGPSGTGKSSLIAAIANHLKFDVFDLQLRALESDWELQQLLLTMSNRSILVVEDIDRCNIQLIDQQESSEKDKDKDKDKITLSGLLNSIDGLWSSCGTERIIIFTTNNKDKLDPALLRPGRMDVHIHMSYCSPQAFKILANNYLGIDNHKRFIEIEKLIEESQVTTAEVAEHLIKYDHPDIALQGLIDFIMSKNSGNEQ
ncbi:AAA-ATPase At3g50940-like [Silene latifolia]|uniref:AAA-ATPase At3g50940-like n=1 Tax=Silene latifolia TaxID=37657 RepID=UPI003D78070B